ncbi:hypothetical protein [Paraflavitalea soli]|nr:hypothetical protein [Paraflavitalea soli]
MKRINLLIFLLSVCLVISCNNKSDKQASKEKTHLSEGESNILKEKISEENIFWQSGDCEFLFKNDGSVIALKHEKDGNTFTENGKWSYDKEDKNLTLAWNEKKQRSVTVAEILPEWTEIYTSDNIYFGEGFWADTWSTMFILKRMKLIDDRFNVN